MTTDPEQSQLDRMNHAAIREEPGKYRLPGSAEFVGTQMASATAAMLDAAAIGAAFHGSAATQDGSPYMYSFAYGPAGDGTNPNYSHHTQAMQTALNADRG